VSAVPGCVSTGSEVGDASELKEFLVFAETTAKEILLRSTRVRRLASQRRRIKFSTLKSSAEFVAQRAPASCVARY